MGGADPFSDEDVPLLHPVEALQEMAELLDLVHFWRTRAEALQDEKNFRIRRWRRQNAKPEPLI